MSRNVRRKYPSTPTKGKPVKRRDSDSSSSLDFSDLSDGYSGVDEVSDSEDDDEEGVVAAEEEHIITRVSRKDRDPGSSRPVQDEDSDADEEDDDDDDDDNDDDLEPDDEDGDQSASWDGIPSEAEGSTASELGGDDAFMLAEDLPAARRQVRFTGVPDSDSDSTTSEMSDDMTEYFPDIFVEQTSLDPAFRREIEQDLDDVSSNSSFWDFHDTYDRNAEQSGPIDFFQGFEDETPLATPHGSHPPTEASTPVPSTEEAQDLDGYESEFVATYGCILAYANAMYQPMATLPRRISRSHSLVEDRSVAARLSRPLPTLRPILPSRLGAEAALAPDGSIWTVPCRNPLLL